MQSRRILAPVGAGPLAQNRPEDVKVIQLLLNAQMNLGPVRPLPTDGRVTAELISRIELFQRTVVRMARPDGRIDPAGKSMLALNQNQVGAQVSNNFTLSAAATKLLKEVETGTGEPQLKPYDDQTGKTITQWVKGATIGYGHLISSQEWSTYKNGITKEQADTLFTKDLGPFMRAVNSKIKVALTQQQFDALVILAFNIGEPDFNSSSVVKMINNPAAQTAYPSLDAAWKAWNKSQGKVMKGLENRRAAELNIYHKGIYQRW